MTTADAFLTNCRLADGRLVDIGIADGKIAIVGEGPAPARSNSAPALDIGGDLVLPGLVDGHMHLDKTLTGLPWMGHAAGPTRMSRIETDKTILPHLQLSTEERAGNLICECVARHQPSADPCRHRSRKRPREAGRGARGSRASP
jgi:cytosine deaminase